ncbi:S41 family peptidase [Virgibacillus sp. W0430]|uniref:S41 family peptidase n=1 Tax=Virgibacillus sp. W0430 TaxID=3391580 RepID=UPI003F48A40A
MYFKKRYLAIILIIAFVCGLAGAFTGAKLLQTNLFKQNAGSSIISEKELDNSKDDLSKVMQAYQLIKQHYINDVADDELFEGAIQGMLNTLDDPYSTYMDVEAMERFNEQIESSFQGIGAEVSMVEDKVTIVAPIKDSPAEAAGLRPNDQILSVDQEKLEGYDLNEAVEKIRGEKGSEVVLEIQRAGVSEPFEVTIVRDDIPVETVYSDMKTIDGKKTGVLTITSFAEHTAEEFAEQLSTLEADGIQGLIIDVRGNPGGILDSVEKILEHFIPSNIPYIQIEDQKGNKKPYYTNLDKKKTYPINVLIDEGSASASEILAVAMKEIGYDVIGMTSYGKGTVQQAVPLGDGSTIKLTFYKWLSPEGNWINEKGVEPTIEKKQPEYFYSHPIQIEAPLTYNHTSDKIKNIQIMLSGLGYDTDRTDGYFDQQTTAAVKEFQTDHSIKPTGDVDEKTASLIETKVVEKIRAGTDDQQLQEALNHLYN